MTSPLWVATGRLVSDPFFGYRPPHSDVQKLPQRWHSGKPIVLQIRARLCRLKMRKIQLRLQLST